MELKLETSEHPSLIRLTIKRKLRFVDKFVISFGWFCVVSRAIIYCYIAVAFFRGPALTAVSPITGFVVRRLGQAAEAFIGRFWNAAAAVGARSRWFRSAAVTHRLWIALSPEDAAAEAQRIEGACVAEQTAAVALEGIACEAETGVTSI